MDPTANLTSSGDSHMVEDYNDVIFVLLGLVLGNFVGLFFGFVGFFTYGKTETKLITVSLPDLNHQIFRISPAVSCQA